MDGRRFGAPFLSSSDKRVSDKGVGKNGIRECIQEDQ
jgi:hypothetical protein